MDICVVTYRSSSDRIRPWVRPHDILWERDNTSDNIGYGAACNELARQGKQNVILFVNPDGDPQDGCFDRLERCILDDPTIVAAGPALGPWWSAQAILQESDEHRWLSGACLAVRRSAFEQVGGFDPSLFLYWEDVDLSWKLAQLGELALCPDVAFLHDPKPRGNSAKAEYYLARNKMIVSRRWQRPYRARDSLKAAIATALHGNMNVGIIRAAATITGSIHVLREQGLTPCSPTLRSTL